MNQNYRKVSHEAIKFMSRAIRMAQKGLGRTSPNPMVGAVVVKNGKIVGEGFHRALGEPHAEVDAIRAAGAQTEGAELFVTLEPCNHYGRTPPCTQAIMAAGIKKVYYGIDDPNPSVIGGGAEFLRKAGVEVVGQVLENRCRALNDMYLTNVTFKRPFVYLKLAMSLDGRVATRTGHSQWITSEQSRMRVHRLRDRVTAVMVGIKTVLADNPFLTTRLNGREGRDPVRIVADSNLRTPLEANIFNQMSPAGVIIATRRNPPSRLRARLEKKGCRVIETTSLDKVDLKDLLTNLYQIGITSLLIEGGAGLAWGALEARIVDRCMFFYAPIIIGGKSAPSGVSGAGIDRLEQAPRLVDMRSSRIGPDILVEGKVVYPGDQDDTTNKSS
ncbi:MAG: diaminohydroxyphosphoribosylaminopyrimidine deaminase [Thermodesulfobacteriota bacterium]|jgi:diaminohydroxyphosphoribosylaminopyrimidine deaminase/5-amino-6-(5-phosphoribosylamino)uracil reductase|nr:diaminohydroxyphosphoribosylaminopyrimidine deaminase [Thermodesulfobacteriota bacterium]